MASGGAVNEESRTGVGSASAATEDSEVNDRTLTSLRGGSATAGRSPTSSFNFLPQLFWQNISSFLLGSKKMGSATPDGTLESEFSLPLFPYQSLPNKKRPKAGELIELASFGFVEIENIERQGAGHEFQPANLDHPAWCDRCGDLIWCVGRLGQLVQCTRCKFTCHAGCLQFITVDCQPQPPVAPLIERVDRAPSPNLSISNLSREELMLLINKHNRRFPDLEMSLSAEGDSPLVVTGFIRVCMNLMRPINVISGTRPPSIYDALKQDDTLTEGRTLTSFYLPMDTMKALHVDSDMTAQRVIVTLLKKFKVADSPLKYALYESYMEGEGKLKLRRLNDLEKPLVLTLTWMEKGLTDRQFLLQENDGADINWEMFALPELENFIKILQIEEAEYLRQIRVKYASTQEVIQKLLEQKMPRSPTHDDDRYY
ncbi:ras association domain-containing protein 1-like [Tropilaelaps mercedesae]|uniref:Ras association domain-containing protein 1-like n=1 Tax=Tropilaelaps mercedesae TaxID=418985 RepID=A0A1V9XTU6_9ACAR|nr:ras association domain-containing protein 1-like [Tropilaelaps mercedesae]